MAPESCLDRPDFILSLNVEKNLFVAGHVYADIPVFVWRGGIFHQYIQVGCLNIYLNLQQKIYKIICNHNIQHH